MSDTGKSWDLTEKERARLAKVRADLKAGLNPYRDTKGIGLEFDKPLPVIKSKSARQERKERLARWNNLGVTSPSHVHRTVHTLVGPPPKVKPKPLDPMCCICERKVELTTSVWGRMLESLTHTSSIEIVNYLTPDGKVLPVPYKLNSARPSTVTGRVCHRKKCQAKIIEILEDPAFKSPRAMLHEPVLDERPGHRTGFSSRVQRKYGV